MKVLPTQVAPVFAANIAAIAFVLSTYIRDIRLTGPAPAVVVTTIVVALVASNYFGIRALRMVQPRTYFPNDSDYPFVLEWMETTHRPIMQGQYLAGGALTSALYRSFVFDTMATQLSSTVAMAKTTISTAYWASLAAVVLAIAATFPYALGPTVKPSTATPTSNTLWQNESSVPR